MFKELAVVMGGVIIAIVLVVYLMIMAGNHLSFPGEQAEIEQLRSDAAKIDTNSSEDVAGQVAEVNRKIASMQKYNKLWYSALLVPNEWENIEPISIRSVGGENK